MNKKLLFFSLLIINNCFISAQNNSTWKEWPSGVPFKIKPEIVKAGKPKEYEAKPYVTSLSSPKKYIYYKNYETIEKPYISKAKLDTVTEISFTEKEITLNKIKAKSPYTYKFTGWGTPDAFVNNFKYADQNTGFPSSNVRYILRDKKGNMWFCTHGNGIVSFNGIIFKHYTEKQGLGNNYLMKICFDKDDNLWMATWGGGFIKFDGEYFYNYRNSGFQAENFCNDIICDNSNVIWFATEGNGLLKYENEKFYELTTNEGLNNNFVKSVLLDNKNNIWVGYNSGHITKITLNKSYSYLIKDKDKEYVLETKDLALYSDKIVIATKKSGLYVFDEVEFKQYSLNYGMNKEYSSIYIDSNSNIWLGIWNFGVAKLNFNTNKYTYFDSYSGIKTIGIYSVYSDQNGICWIGTSGSGVMRYNGEEISHINSSYGLPSNYITQITKDKNNILWFATNTAGIFTFNGDEFYSYSTKEGFIHNYCTSIYCSADNAVWASTYGGGICKLLNNKLFWYSTEEGLATNNVRWITGDKAGNIWFAYGGEGLAKFDGKNIYEYTTKEGLPHNDIRHIICDHDNNIWFTTWDGGAVKFDGNNFYIYNNLNSINTNVTTCLFLDKDNNIWLGTEGGGLSKITENKILHITTKEGLSNDMIMGIAQSDNGDIWVSTIKGINLLKEDGNKYSVKQFGVDDGLNGLSFYNGSLFYEDKTLLAGSEKNLTILKENLFDKKTEIPKIYITELMVNYVTPDWDSLIEKKQVQFTACYKWSNLPIKPVFKYTSNNITFSFNAISWGNEHRIIYRYMLNSMDKTWHPATKYNEANYNNIPPGEHTFYVQASIDGQTWSESAVYNFVISPPWWQTWLFRITAALFSIIIILLLFRWRTATLRKRQKQLEKTVEERTLEIVKQKNQIELQKKEVELQKEIVEEKNREIVDSINYAKRLQEAILPPLKLVKQELEQSFIIYKPKDIVAGDFYWMHTTEVNNKKKIIFAAADCTGHGVPGAMVSVVCSNALNRTVKEFGIINPGNILDKVRELVLETFEKSESEVKDGMDISLCALTTSDKIEKYDLEWAGANNPLWLIRKNSTEIIEINGDKQPIGKNDNPRPFSTHSIKLMQGDTIYIFTDGYSYQFGGDKGKKLKSSNFKKLLLSIQNESFEKHREIINNTFEKWRGDLEQVDDVCVIGVRI